MILEWNWKRKYEYIAREICNFISKPKAGDIVTLMPLHSQLGEGWHSVFSDN